MSIRLDPGRTCCHKEVKSGFRLGPCLLKVGHSGYHKDWAAWWEKDNDWSEEANGWLEKKGWLEEEW